MSGVEFEENIYYEQSENPDVFHVQMVNNPAAEKCKLSGAYEFHISTENFSLFDPKQKRRLYTWPFRYIRRYGKSSTNFQFEAGRKTQSGEGLFSLLTREGEGEQIFAVIQTRFNEMKERDRQYKSGSQEGPGPQLPPRAYENNEVPQSRNSHTEAKALREGSKKVSPPPKPIRSSGTNVASKPALPASRPPVPASTKPQTPQKLAASDLNQILQKAKPSIAAPKGPNGGENTYDVMGAPANEGAGAYGAAYGAVYGSPSGDRGLYVDDPNTYDEVNQ